MAGRRSARARTRFDLDVARGLHAATVDGADEPDPGVLLSLRGLRTVFRTDDGVVNAVDGIDADIRRGATTCIVGESGSGKSATARSVLQVVDNPGLIEAGRMLYRRTPDAPVIDLAALEPTGAALRSIRGKEIGLVFQEPMSALSPVHTIGNQIVEVLRLHDPAPKEEMRARAVETLARVGIPRPEERFDAYTFQLSGGMRQRAMIAMSLICKPSLLIADEPTTALDVTTQAQILTLLAELKETMGMTMMFITHDLGVVAEIADEVVVMRHGAVVEQGSVDDIFHRPQHEYTQRLLSTLPQRDASGGWAVGTGARQRTSPTTLRQSTPLLQIKELDLTFSGSSGRLFGRGGTPVHAVNRVSLDVAEGSTVGLVGESGCGKTSLGRCVLRAYQPSSGQLLYRSAGGDVVDLAAMDEKQLKPYRHEVRMVFQDPYGSLNPRLTVRQVIGDPLRAARVGKDEIEERVADMLVRVGLRRDMASRYPHAFSGGERQRIGIARALITRPRLVVADEAVSALDVSVRAQILELMAELQQDLGLTYLFISHDLSVVERICDRVAVMYFGRLVEEGTATEVFGNPQHDYTRALLSAVPIPDPRLRGTRPLLTYRPDDDPSAAA
ncbi:dipeptide ABC transporter ATP-binding protein [Auraticoccus sp. F435]|uniref:Dipeptide ABC transporter ATP-binding protein n=1 Tax=Auraticoccus cholistanensis TaxID=2656650 RepID=A0A6A9UWV4_9ACTN|nr:ABC transporter ATP-binding protein [Auraticoccus cholistanensis]MVA75707.1 dipeptide ABC transporter ATP-binding protein [Auraticoccus cholistanensis]